MQEALARDRAIGLVELEAAILLELARLRFVQADERRKTDDEGRKAKNEGRSSSVLRPPSSVEYLMHESFNYAHKALEIAERCEYRLQQADIHNFLAEWWMAQADQGRKAKDEGKASAFVVRPSSSVAEALAKARIHATRAQELAWCDGAPYHYKVAYERAEALLRKIENL